MQMYSSPRVSDSTPNPSCCTDSRALLLGNQKAKAHPIVHIDEVDCLEKGYSRQSNQRRFGSPPQIARSLPLRRRFTLLVGADGSLTHDWLNHYLGLPAAKRNIKLTRIK